MFYLINGASLQKESLSHGLFLINTTSLVQSQITLFKSIVFLLVCTSVGVFAKGYNKNEQMLAISSEQIKTL